MMRLLNREFTIEDIFSYADDVAICICSIGELHKVINIINKWSNEAGILINFRKSFFVVFFFIRGDTSNIHVYTRYTCIL